MWHSLLENDIGAMIFRSIANSSGSGHSSGGSIRAQQQISKLLFLSFFPTAATYAAASFNAAYIFLVSLEAVLCCCHNHHQHRGRSGHSRRRFIDFYSILLTMSAFGLRMHNVQLYKYVIIIPEKKSIFLSVFLFFFPLFFFFSNVLR